MPILTKPQVKFLTSIMRQSRSAYSSESAVRNRLLRAGSIELGDDGWQPTRKGLLDLRDYRSLRWANYGCEAYLKQLQEVEAALAARFPEPLKLAA